MSFALVWPSSGTALNSEWWDTRMHTLMVNPSKFGQDVSLSILWGRNQERGPQDQQRAFSTPRRVNAEHRMYEVREMM